MSDSSLQHFQAALFQRYTIERELGRGGMATVYLAQDLKLHRPVALKILRPELAASLGAERFLREIQIAARLSHPYILPLHDSGEAGGRLYYAMPYVEGESLRQRLEREGQLPLAETIAIVGAVASALTYAHRHGVIHRDIKPENILLANESGTSRVHPLVADFGIARALDAAGSERLTETGLALGTPAYMSPEQAAGGRIDGRSDIYALGCVAYEMLAGAPPFTGPSTRAVLARHAVDAVPSLHTVRSTVHRTLEAAIERALAKVPADRFDTADDFADALTKHSSTGRYRDRLSRARVALGMGVGVVAAGTGTIMLRGSSAGVVPLAATMAVLPFAAGADTGLNRLGKDLAVTLSASLDGLGGIETADRLRIVQEIGSKSVLSVEEAASLARRVGASSFLRGTLVRAGDRVRLDAGLYGAEALAPLAEGITITAHRDSIGTLTDSTAWALLRQIWRRGEPPSPSLAAVTTQSLQALRSFLDGERHIEKDAWKSAALAYRSAISSDSTFWLAYFRYVLARRWNEEEIEPAILSSLDRNRTAFPDRERLLVEAMAEDSMPHEGELLREVTKRFPDYWPGWFHLGDFLYHVGPLIGYTWKDTQKALNQAVSLNSRLKPAYHHLFWNSTGKDSAEADRALERFRAVPGLDPLDNRLQRTADLQHMRMLNALARSDGVITPQNGSLVDSLARFYLSRDVSGFQKSVWPFSLLWAWNPAGQIAFNRRVLRFAADAPSRAAALRGNSWAWAERGAWDSSLSSAHEAMKYQAMALNEYFLAVGGAWLGAISPHEAVERRSAANSMINGLEEGEQKRQSQGLSLWLDGFLAFVRRDEPALKRAQESVHQSGHPDANVIERSLEAFGRALGGDRRAAALDLVALERECAGNYWDKCGQTVAPNIAAHRLSAATWLLEAGDTAQAKRLLIWHEARFFPWNWSFVVRPLAYLMLARIEEAQGQGPQAKEHYEQFLRHYDSPMPDQQYLVNEARTARARLSGTNAAETR